MPWMGLRSSILMMSCALAVSANTDLHAAETWVTRSGHATLWFPPFFDVTIPAVAGIDATSGYPLRGAQPAAQPVASSSGVTFSINDSGVVELQGSLTCGEIVIMGTRGAVTLPQSVLEFPASPSPAMLVFQFGQRRENRAITLENVNVQFHRPRRQLVITSDSVVLSSGLAEALGISNAADWPRGLATILLDADLVSGSEPTRFDYQTGAPPDGVLAATGGVGPDVIVSDLQNVRSYGTMLTCRHSGEVCEDDADCNACSDTAGPCLADSDCRICTDSRFACSTDNDCKTCSGSGLPCTFDAECGGTESCDANQACVVSGATCLVTGDTCDAPIASFAVGTTSCNIGDQPATWVSFTNQHPVIAQNLYRLKDNRFEQIGMSWVKHGFFAITGTLCGECTTPPGPAGSRLGVGCSDPYSASLNGQQNNLGPRSDVNPLTGAFPYPFDATAAAPVIGKRLQVSTNDLDPALNAGALYFVEGHYITPDDALAGNGNNNASYRRVEVAQNPDGSFLLQSSALIGTTQRQECGIRAWKDFDATVVETDVQIPGEGLLIVAGKATDLGTGIWQYEYAVQNLNSDQGCRAIEISLPQGAVISEVGFHDVEHHSGEPYDGEDWTVTVTESAIRWSTSTFEENVNANAIRWGSLYSFHFRANVEPDVATVKLSLFRPGFFDEVSAVVIGPKGATIDCNANGIADSCDLDCAVAGCVWPCGGSTDCNANAVPDECELDCNQNGRADTCDIADGTSGDCNANTVPDECEPDCDGDMLPDDCDTFDDTDGDGIPDCFDACPLTSPAGACQCPTLGRCCFTELFCLDDFPLSTCEEDGGTPECRVSQLCRDGCLVNDLDDDGDVDLFDVAGVQRCFTGRAVDTGFLVANSDCLRVFDVTADQAVDLEDVSVLLENLTGP